MFVTSRYIGTPLGDMHYLLFVLLEDYVRQQQHLTEQLADPLSALARSLGTDGAVVKPFPDDAPQTQRDVLDKPWSEGQERSIRVTPGLLIIDRNFDDFDPRHDPWLHVHLRDYLNESGQVQVFAFEEAAQAIAAACRERVPLKDLSAALANERALAAAGAIFELNPGILGISINLREALMYIQRLLRP
jgi:hypothetical protein